MNNHQAIRDNIKPCDILLSRNKRHPMSSIIAGITRSNWSHAFFYIGDNKIIESAVGGVAIRPLDKYLNDIYSVGLFRLEKDLTEEQVKKVIKTARKLSGLEFGYLQLVWMFILRLFRKSEDPDWGLDVSEGVMCSELVAHAYESIGVYFKNLPPFLIEPADIDESTATVRVA
jgi:hypothetical protein